MSFNQRGYLGKRFVCKTLALAMLATYGVATVANEPESSETEVPERLVVTGSRLMQSEVEGAIPVTVITRTEIDASGATNLPDALRAATQNSFGSARQQSGSAAQSVATINLRGLGSDRTLVLIDGHRTAKVPTDSGSSDLNVIPLAAVERIEILRDGASAIYGSDAIGGVVNIITRKDFNGAELRYGNSQASREGGTTEEASLIIGSASDKTQTLFGVGYNRRDIVFQRDRAYSRHSSSPFGNNWSETDFPNAITSADADCTAPGFFLTEMGTCNYDFAEVAANDAAIKNVASFFNVRYQFSDNWSLYLNSSAAHTESFGRYAAVSDRLFIAADHVDIDGNSDNPYGRDMLILHRFAALGTRDSSTEADVYNLLIGAQLDGADWRADIGVHASDYNYDNTGRNFLNRRAAASFVEAGLYDFRRPMQNSPDVLNAMRATVSQESYFQMHEGFANLSTDLFALPGGMAELSFGAEFRSERFSDQYDAMSEAGMVGGGGGSSSAGARHVSAGYMEMLLPLTEALTVDVAARHDRYSDYGSDTVPKLSVAYRVADGLLLRTSYGRGFHAPDMDVVSIKSQQYYDYVLDPATCVFQGLEQDCSLTGEPWSAVVDTRFQGNPALNSESSRQWSAGIVWDPSQWLSTSLDYYRIELADSIRLFSAQDVLDSIQMGNGVPNGLEVQRADLQQCDAVTGEIVAGADGQIDACDPVVNIVTGYANQGRIQTSGFDLSVRGKFALATGEWQSLLSWSQVREFEIGESGNLVGVAYLDEAYPKYRARLQHQYAMGPLTLSLNSNYIAGYRQRFSDPQETIPGWLTHDLQVEWQTPWRSRIVLGATNITDKEPPTDSATLANYNMNLYDAYGRLVYVRLSQSF